jgi:cleavage and polyadenylation specificity factor subunit 1
MGEWQVYNLPDLTAPIFVAEHFSSLPPLLKQHHSAELTSPRTPATATFATTEEITEILLADLGDEITKEPYLIARNAEDDIIIYKLFLTPSSPTLPSSVAFIKVPNPIISTPRPDRSEKQTHRTMVSMSNVNGYSCVFVPGSDPAFILKTAQSIPHLHRLAGSGVRSLSPFHTSSCDRGFIFIDFNGVVRVSLLPSSDWSFTSPFHSKKIYLPTSIRSVAWYDPMSVVVAATTKRVPFSLDEEDGKPAAESFDPAQLHPHIDSGSLIIVSPLTHTIVDTYQFAHNEVPLIVDSIPLEISEHTHERRHLLAVGTGIFRGEDHSARGGIYVFEVIEVVPEPGRPETNRKLKLVTREEVKGTVSALCGVNGYLLAAQGQKIMIRGLKEDQSLLPVAFMDMNTYITVACSLPSSPGLLLFGDGLKSLWFCGFSEEPYKVSLFGKDADTVGVLAAEFLPDPSTGLLAFVLVDGKGNMLVLNYDHEHSKSLSGQRLMRRANFHSAHEIMSLRLLPSTSAEEEEGYLLLAATRTGSLGSISMIGENSYRRLNMLQNQVVVGEEHVAGCNPKAFRHVAGTDRTGEILRGVLDRGLLERWMGLGVVRRAEMAAKAGMEVGLARGEVLGAGGMEGLGFL